MTEILSKANQEAAVSFSHSLTLPALMRERRFSLLVSTYQAQRILLISPGEEKLNVLMRTLPKPTGMAFDGNRLAICSKYQVWLFLPAGQVRTADGTNLPYTFCLAPRTAFVTGDILAHDAAWVHDVLCVVNTRFSCLATLSADFSFIPGWKPSFVSELSPDDRCHLNGLAVRDNGSLVVSAFGATDRRSDWKAGQNQGGVLVDVTSNELLAQGLCMPHSPRWHNNQLWVLESGSGSLQLVDESKGTRTTVIRLPGYLRGLAFFENLAFVGMCSLREEHLYSGLPIQESVEKLICGVAVVNLDTGALQGIIEFTKGITELFDIAVIRDAGNPHIIGFEEETIQGLFVLP